MHVCTCVVVDGPIVTQDLMFSLQTLRYQQPPVYKLSIITTGSPATFLDWQYSNEIINIAGHANLYQQQREVIDASTCTTKSTLTVTGSFFGLFSVSVSNQRTKDGSVNGTMAEKGESAVFVKGKMTNVWNW